MGRPLEVLLLAGARMIAALLGFAAIWQLAHALDAVSLGLWSMLLALHGYGLQIAEFGLRSVVTATAGASATGAAGLLLSYLRLRIVLAAIVWVLLVAASSLLMPATWPASGILFLSLFAIACQFDWIPLARGDGGRAARLHLVRPAAFLLLTTVVAAGGAGLTGAALAFTGAWIAASLASLPALRILPERRCAAGGAPERNLLRAGWPLCLLGLSGQAQYGLDLLLAGLFLGPAAASRYYLAHAATLAGLVFANAAGQLVLARIGGHRRQGGEMHATILRATLSTLLIGLLLAAVLQFLAVPFLERFAGAHFRTLHAVVPWLLPWFVLQHGTAILQAALAATARGRAALFANLAMASALVPALMLATLSGDLRLFALARGAGELVRLAALLRSLRRDGGVAQERQAGDVRRAA